MTRSDKFIRAYLGRDDVAFDQLVQETEATIMQLEKRAAHWEKLHDFRTQEPNELKDHLNKLLEACKLLLLYSLPPHDVSGSREYDRARQLFDDVVQARRVLEGT